MVATPTSIFEAGQRAAASQTSTAIKDMSQVYTDTKITETRYQYTENNFPGDLGTEQNAHYMKIVAFTGGGGLQAPNTRQWTARLPIPDSNAGGQMPLIYEHQHNFADIRLTNIINDSLLGITASLTTRRSLNPMVQVLYRSSNLRQFDFALLVTPKNANEAQQLELIQRNLRAYAAPEINGAVVIAPAEFEIHFFRGGQINPHLPRIARCVVSRVNIDYGPTGTYTALVDAQPKSMKITFTATEVRVIDRNKILNGDSGRVSGYGNIGY